MPSLSTYAVFLATGMALLLVPGPAVLYVVTRSIEMGRAGGLASVAGITTATVAHVTLATAGLSSLLLASRPAFDAVRYVGATYLLLLGVRRLLGFGLDDAEEEQAPRTRSRPYAQGVGRQPHEPEDDRLRLRLPAVVRRRRPRRPRDPRAVWTPSRAR